VDARPLTGGVVTLTLQAMSEHRASDHPASEHRASELRATVTILARAGEPGLVRSLAEVPPGGVHAGTAAPGGELWFVIEGSGRLDLDGAPGPALLPDRGMWIPGGTACRLQSGGSGWLRLDMVALPAQPLPTEPGTEGAGVPLSRDLRDCPVETTGDRQFRVLFGPGRDCSVATQFVGEIPPGRAPEHSHPYDEVVLVLQGTGAAHLAGTDRELSAGACVHLPPGLPHCLENTGTQAMRVLGVFHPADTPAAKLPPSP
jgi:quercetin dioxygenase-like cupin family protein